MPHRVNSSNAAGRHLNRLTAAHAASKIAGGEITSAELVNDCLARIEARDPDIHAWAFVDREIALAQARARDAETRRSVLHGVPIGIKDIFDTYDMPTSHGFRPFKSHRPSADSAVVSLLRRAGLVIIGKCTTTEFATPLPAGVRNPHDFGRSPGVSSSGSAASVADFMTAFALGSQTGGSTILPASFCGVAGFKASLTGIDRGATRHLRPTLDTIGLFARDVGDLALLNSVLTGRQPAKLPKDVRSFRVGLCHTFNWSQAQPETIDALESASRLLTAAGSAVVDAELPAIFNDLESSFQVISTFEGAATMAGDIREHGAEMNQWLQDTQRAAGTITVAQYEKAQLHALACQRELERIFERCDFLLTPSACGEATSNITGVSNSAFNRIWTLMHGPCVNIPAFKGPHGLPVGVQIVGPVASDAAILAFSEAAARVFGSQ
jgi:Asp-tRNA(Asn)/Glu-tRNA(Gln) amidotransferase A subunit family amidase